MPAFDQSKLSSDEWQFIRLYCFSVQREYDLIQIVQALIDPGFGIESVSAAVVIAKKMYAEQVKFVDRLYETGSKHLKAKPQDEPTAPELIATIFTQSFFKLVDSKTKKALVTDKNMPQHDGWSSGHPLDWQTAIYNLQEIHKQKLKSSQLAENIFITALLKLFSILPPDFANNAWLINEYPMPDEYYEEDDDDEEEDEYYGQDDYS